MFWGVSGKQIRTPNLSIVKVAIAQAVDRHGHPHDVPIGALEGVDPETADVCFALLSSEPFPMHPMAATAKWLRLVEESSQQARNTTGSPRQEFSSSFGHNTEEHAQS
jgi:hypothetical protein